MESCVWRSSFWRSDSGSQHLEGYLAVVLEIVGQIDHGHAAATDLSFDGVAVGQGGLQSVQQVGHVPIRLLGPAGHGRNSRGGRTPTSSNGVRLGVRTTAGLCGRRPDWSPDRCH